MKADSHFRTPWARIESVRRRVAGKASPGDRATARLGPGAIQLLETAIAGSAFRIGEGYQAPYNVPFGVAATAAYAVIAPAQGSGVSWTGRDIEIEWRAPAGALDTIVAEAVIEEVDEGLACCGISGHTADGCELFTGRLRLTAVRGGRAIPSPLAMPFSRVPDPAPPRLPGKRLLVGVIAPPAMEAGQTAPLTIEVANDTEASAEAVISLALPFGHGLSTDHNGEAHVEVPPGSTARRSFPIRADRPHEVNLGRPWPVVVTAALAGTIESHTVEIAVTDPEPGRVLYVLSEDCETFDGGPRTGDYGSELAALGNANNFMDPEEYRVQMIDKPARMNAIADRHGAKWTHFWCAPQRFAADWAAAQSSTGEWSKLAADLDQSIQAGSLRHEYAPHIHYDYEPDSKLPPQPRLVYDAPTDGILPNDYYDPDTNRRHHWHDWDGSGRGISNLKALGDLTALDTKAGSLYKSLRYLSRLQAQRRYPLIARLGGFDFGVTAEDQETSTAAFEANGLRAGSDARFLDGRAPRGTELYWCDPGDRTKEAQSLEAVRLAQLAVAYETDFSDSGAMNRWFAQTIEAVRGPGVRVMHAMTHAMFLRGVPDPFLSLDGGSFEELDRHLEWVSREHPEVQFATATEAVVEYLDYYTPSLEAFVLPELCAAEPGERRFLYPVRLLGRGIRVDETHPASLRLVAPPWFNAADVENMRLIADGAPVAQASAFHPGARPAIEVSFKERPAGLWLEITLTADAEFVPCASDLVEPAELERPPLFALSAPEKGRFSTGLLKLLMNPVAGGSDPLGRRLHPLGVFVMGVALSAAIGEAEPSSRPVRLRLRWRKPPASDQDLLPRVRLVSGDCYDIRIVDETGDVIADSEVVLAPGVVLPDAVERDDPHWRAVIEQAVRRAEEAERDRDAARAASRSWQAEMERAMSIYRRQRAWRVMLWVRKAYAVLSRQGAGAFLAWLPRSLSSAGRIEDEELHFPKLKE